MAVRLELDPLRIAYFAREATWRNIFELEPTAEDLERTARELGEGKVLGAAKEVPALGFLVKASRVAMDQLLRLRESGAGAQTTRDNDIRDWDMVIPDQLKQFYDEDEGLREESAQLEELARDHYANLVDAGAVPQDARYWVPLGFVTHWVQNHGLTGVREDVRASTL